MCRRDAVTGLRPNVRPHVGHHRSRPLQRLLTACWPSAAGCGASCGSTRDPSPNRASRIDRGKRAGPRRGARDTDAYDDQERADESLKHRAARRCPSLPRRLEPQPRGGVTRRAVAQRRSRASGLTRPWAEVIRGFGLEFCCRFGSPIPLRYGVSFLFSVFYL